MQLFRIALLIPTTTFAVEENASPSVYTSSGSFHHRLLTRRSTTFIDVNVKKYLKRCAETVEMVLRNDLRFSLERR